MRPQCLVSTGSDNPLRARWLATHAAMGQPSDLQRRERRSLQWRVSLARDGLEQRRRRRRRCGRGGPARRGSSYWQARRGSSHWQARAAGGGRRRQLGPASKRIGAARQAGAQCGSGRGSSSCCCCCYCGGHGWCSQGLAVSRAVASREGLGLQSQCSRRSAAGTGCSASGICLVHGGASNTRPGDGVRFRQNTQGRRVARERTAAAWGDGGHGCCARAPRLQGWKDHRWVPRDRRFQRWRRRRQLQRSDRGGELAGRPREDNDGAAA